MTDLNDFKVDIIGVGAPKCGTTWVSSMLVEHGEIDFAKSKETFYFLSNLNKFRQDIGGFRRIDNEVKLKNEFHNDGRLRAEFSTMYLFDKDALKNIYEHNDQAKIIICLRPPWEFLFSAYQFDKNSNFGHLIENSFSTYLNNWSAHSLIRREWAQFSTYISDVYQIFLPENIHIICMDEIKDNKLHVLKRLYQFCGIDHKFIPLNYDEFVNETMSMRSRSLQVISHNVLEFSQRIPILRKALHFIIHRRGWTRKMLFRLLKTKKNKESISKEEVEKLRSEFASDIEAIYRITGNKIIKTWLTG